MEGMLPELAQNVRSFCQRQRKEIEKLRMGDEEKAKLLTILEGDDHSTADGSGPRC